MTSPRHLLILLGFLAQGLTWDSYAFLAGCFGLWFVALKWLKGRITTTVSIEALMLIAGCAASILVSRLLNRSSHFFLGDGLIVLQAVRLLRPLTQREKLTSVIIAAFHFGVLCTLAPNIRFVLLYVGALFLFPGALKEVFADFEPGGARIAAPVPREYRFLPSARVCFWLLLGSAVVFIGFPRFTGTPLQLREGMGDQGSLLDSILDPRRSGRANSQQVLLQVDGDHIGYMRCLALTEFDGVRWSTDRGSRLIRMRFVPPGELHRFEKRTVYVKNSQYLGRILPVDGRPVSITGNFFSPPFVNPDGVIECSAMVTTGNNVYTYYIDREAAAEPLSPNRRRHLTWHPPQSEALKRWVEEKSATGTNGYQRALFLTRYLRDNFTYEIGTPELNRISPVEDFVFNRRTGHCERFAASLALMLRMQGIPTRVAIGYVPTTRNLFNGRAQVRFRDAHSWTEAYFDDQGWVTLDATPGPPPTGTGSDLLDLMDALDFAWYSHIVNFNGFAQQELLQGSRRMLSALPSQTWPGLKWGMLILLTTLCAVKYIRLPVKKNSTAPEAKRQAAARLHYEKMLQHLENLGHKKSADQTPLEFLGQLQKGRASVPASVITQNFCDTYYGGKNSGSEDQVRGALRDLEQLTRNPSRERVSVG